MKTFYHLLILFFNAILIIGFSLPIKAQAIVNASSIPADQWESHPEAGIDVAIFLTKEKRNNKPIYLLQVFLKNKSQNKKEHAYTHDYGFHFFYTDNNAVKHDLHHVIEGAPDDAHGRAHIFPNETLECDIELDSTTDLTFFTTNSVQCEFPIFDEAPWECPTKP